MFGGSATARSPRRLSHSHFGLDFIDLLLSWACRLAVVRDLGFEITAELGSKHFSLTTL
jgi:hypothetical protein